MIQQLNLLNAIPKPPKVILPTKQLLLILVTFIILLFLFTLPSIFSLSGLSSQYKTLTTSEQVIAKQLLTFKGQNEINTTQKEEVMKLASLVAANKEILTIIQSKQSLNIVGFSEYLTTIADIIPSNAWLTKISLDEGGHSITLSGESFNNTAIIAFVKNLNDVAKLKAVDIRFKLDNIKREVSKDMKNEFTFTIKSNYASEAHDDK